MGDGGSNYVCSVFSSALYFSKGQLLCSFETNVLSLVWGMLYNGKIGEMGCLNINVV